MNVRNGWFGLLLAILFLVGCRTATQPSQAQTPLSAVIPAPNDNLPVIPNPTPDGTLPHSTDDFTQGLLFANGALFESTGRYGESRVRRLDAESGKVLKTQNLSSEHFGEGLALFENKLYQLTWTSQVCLIYDLESLEPQGQLFYPSQGWGLTTSPQERQLIFSDGSSELRFLDPANFVVQKLVTVLDGKDRPVRMLNELEWVKGEIWANVWMTDRIARIDPKTGRVLGWLLFTDLVKEHQSGAEDVLNGIAYDPVGDRLWLTGKLWPKLYRFDKVTERFFTP